MYILVLSNISWMIYSRNFDCNPGQHTLKRSELLEHICVSAQLGLCACVCSSSTTHNENVIGTRVLGKILFSAKCTLSIYLSKLIDR